VKTLFAPAFAAVALLAAADAHADPTRRECVESYDRAQYLKKESKLREAREQLLVCSNDACPVAVKHDCVPWLAEVEAAMPTVSFGVRDEKGKDIAGARIAIDGREGKDAAEGRAVPLDPGRHTIHVETSDGRTADDSFVARAAEKNRIVTVVLKSAAPPVAQPIPPPPPPPEERSLALPIGLGVVGVLGLGAAFGFGFSAKSEADDLRTSCGPSCKDSDLDSVHTKLLLSDIGLGIGVVALAAAAYLVITAPSGGTKSAAIRF
jgi:hypothetical protein